jgi:hypothetical protein
MTNDTKCHSEITVIVLNNKNIKIKIEKNNNNRDTCAQVCSTYINKNNKHLYLKNIKIVINDTKCHSEISVTFINKNITIKTSKNNNDRGMCVQVHGIYKTKINKYIQIKNKKLIINDTKCPFEMNMIFLDKIIKTKTTTIQ